MLTAYLVIKAFQASDSCQKFCTLVQTQDSYDKGKNKGAIHMVSAWASQNSLVLGQVKVNKKSNEITAIPQLLKILEIQGCIVTINATEIQKEIAQEIIEGGGDYILSLKGNQGNIHQDVQQLFDWGFETQFKNIFLMRLIKQSIKVMVASKFVVIGFFLQWNI